MKTLFFIIVLCILIGSVSALTISPVRYNETVSAGSAVSFDIFLSPNIPQETRIELITITGDCASWVSMDTRPSDLPASFHVSATIPTDASNGRHRCDIAFIQPSLGMISAAIGFPLTFDVSGGSPAPVVPVLTTPTEQRTLTAPAQEPTSAPAPLPTSAPAEPVIPIKTVIILFVGVIAFMFGAVIIYDHYRRKQI